MSANKPQPDTVTNTLITVPAATVSSTKLYGYLLTFFCCALLIANIAATKLIAIGPLIFDGGALLFPLTYIFGDIFAEIFGFKGARKAVLISFGVQVVAVLTLYLVQALPAASDWHNQTAFETILGFVPRIVIASLLAYLAGQILNAKVLVKLKQATEGKHLWLRLMGSTLVGELVDSVIFCSIAWFGILSVPALLNYILVGFVYKTVVELVLMPVTYLVIRIIKRRVASPSVS